mmetsp:Transcript_2981/g.6847  ORF Transcript_2981/g.6847 Transcript_2981/m.6847 type:complete len:486 (+) Transcript_2981:201-1658(+)|eukprot:CAMPEP_0178982706 /NCGR_PEP_ID=MMETSP0795-20121207/650_1 /TAXON_ID=88552 /ORGANISM="Amoebophrya sp., Strain Ameob2" /LENGTH=485 /DNA_ID=CAMNT_0020673391 /DNA_START=117 /DNA_END=1574 /DNA_ORIENTATION=-
MYGGYPAPTRLEATGAHEFTAEQLQGLEALGLAAVAGTAHAPAFGFYPEPAGASAAQHQQVSEQLKLQRQYNQYAGAHPSYATLTADPFNLAAATAPGGNPYAGFPGVSASNPYLAQLGAAAQSHFAHLGGAGAPHGAPAAGHDLHLAAASQEFLHPQGRGAPAAAQASYHANIAAHHAALAQLAPGGTFAPPPTQGTALPGYAHLSRAGMLPAGAPGQAAGGNLPRRERFFVKRNGGATEEEVITSQKFLATFRVGIPHLHPFGAAKRIIGPAGRNMKLIASMIMGGKVRLRGEGFQDKDQQHPLQLNISCPTREGYVVAKALVSKLLKQLLQDFHAYTNGAETAQMRGNDHPMNPEMPDGWDKEFMRGYYNNMIDQCIFVTQLPKSGSASSRSSKKTNGSKKSTDSTAKESTTPSNGATGKIDLVTGSSADESKDVDGVESQSTGASSSGEVAVAGVAAAEKVSAAIAATGEVSTSADEQKLN